MQWLKPLVSVGWKCNKLQPSDQVQVGLTMYGISNNFVFLKATVVDIGRLGVLTTLGHVIAVTLFNHQQE